MPKTKNSKHTSEPWYPCDESPIKGTHPSPDIAQADEFHARRCVNNCARINPEAVPDMLHELKRAYDFICQKPGDQAKRRAKALFAVIHKAEAR